MYFLPKQNNYLYCHYNIHKRIIRTDWQPLGFIVLWARCEADEIELQSIPCKIAYLSFLSRKSALFYPELKYHVL